MIRFFRTLRQRLLAQNRVSRYLLYAVGEIVLVVIGILIALQVNNWNEDRKSRSRKNALLQALSVEFQANLNQMDSVLFFDNRVIKFTRKFIDLRLDQADTIPIDTLRSWLQNIGWLWTFNPQNGALRSGISSGDVHLIENDSLINLLFSWQDVVADAGENEERQIKIWMDFNPVMSPYIRKVDYETWFKDMGNSKFTSDYRALIRDPLFEDFVAERYGHTLDAIHELKPVRAQNVRILQLVERELNQVQ